MILVDQNWKFRVFFSAGFMKEHVAVVVFHFTSYKTLAMLRNALSVLHVPSDTSVIDKVLIFLATPFPGSETASSLLLVIIS